MNEPAGLIYLLLETELKRIKIGYSSQDVSNRIRSFQTGNSQILKLIAVIPGGREVEQRLHARFQKYRLLDRIEWFDASQEMLLELREVIRELNGVRM